MLLIWFCWLCILFVSVPFSFSSLSVLCMQDTDGGTRGSLIAYDEKPLHETYVVPTTIAPDDGLHLFVYLSQFLAYIAPHNSTIGKQTNNREQLLRNTEMKKRTTATTTLNILNETDKTFEEKNSIYFAVNCMLEMLKDVLQCRVTLLQLILEVIISVHHLLWIELNRIPFKLFLLLASLPHTPSSIRLLGIENGNGTDMLGVIYPIRFVNAILHNNYLVLFKWKRRRLYWTSIECRWRSTNWFNHRIRWNGRWNPALPTHFSIFITIFFGYSDVSTGTSRIHSTRHHRQWTIVQNHLTISVTSVRLVWNCRNWWIVNLLFGHFLLLFFHAGTFAHIRTTWTLDRMQRINNGNVHHERIGGVGRC